MSNATPMLRQYFDIKREHPDAILFFRMGDFFEMFFEDAETASQILGIALTSRGSYNGHKVPMCGVPHHASSAYVAKLVEKGQKVAICEQVEDPRATKGIVKRAVIRVVTPGSAMEDDEVGHRENVYLAAIVSKGDSFGIAHADLSTGEFRVTEANDWAQVVNELGRIGPAEILVPEDSSLSQKEGLSFYHIEIISKDAFEVRNGERLLKEQLGVHSLSGFGFEDFGQGISAAAAIVFYLQETQKEKPHHVKTLARYSLDEFMFLDEPTLTNLELFKTIRRQSEKGSLHHILDKTITAMGSRLLRRWMAYPLLDILEIKRRLSAVASLREDRIFREKVRTQLEGVYDLERLNGRISLGRANGRDLVALRASVLQLPVIKEMLSQSASQMLSEIGARIDVLEDISKWIEEAIQESPPISIRDGGLIREGYNDALDRLISISRDGKAWMARFAEDEKQRTGISNLKIGYNKVFGYYIEISKSNLDLVPSEYIRKQTLVNGERYITEGLKEYEEMVLNAEEKRVSLEYRLFEEIRARVAGQNERIRETGELIGIIDVLCGLAEVAELYGYTCPTVNDDDVIDITDGRHPVIERTVKDEAFVANDIYLDNRGQQILIITGPNMAGKSTILRQTALTVLMAQMGSFVPASKAVIGRVDRIFCRIGASDDLTRGQSTFMVEMNETANILRHVTPSSLVILDEIGRGTSTYDGLSIAWSVAEALHDRESRGVRTLFATHYHELTQLVTMKGRVKNFNIAVKEWNEQIIFLRKLVPGGTSRSYGIQVARIAGLPETVIVRAKEILENLENDPLDNLGRPRVAHSRRSDSQDNAIQQYSLFGDQDQRLRQWIRKLDISAMTPLEALNELNKLKQRLESDRP
jgi:DNA mismatch repair protein MutS